MSHWIRENAGTLTYALAGAAALGFLYWFVTSEGPQMRRYLNMRRM